MNPLASRDERLAWLTGFTGTAATVFVGPDEVVLVTDPRYGERAAAELTRSGSGASIEVAPAEGQADLVERLLGGRRVGLDESAVTWAQAAGASDSDGCAAAVTERINSGAGRGLSYDMAGGSGN